MFLIVYDFFFLFRNRSGIWGWRSERSEVVNGYETKVSSTKVHFGLMLESALNTHLQQSFLFVFITVKAKNAGSQTCCGERNCVFVVTCNISRYSDSTPI